MMISCKKASELTCVKLDRPLTFLETLRWRFHLFMCANCKAFQRQNETILRVIEQRFRDPGRLQDPGLATLPPDACERLKRRLEEPATTGRASE